MVVGLAFTSVFLYASQNSTNARKRIGALRLAQQRIEEIRGKNFDTLTAGTSTEYGIDFEEQKFNIERKIADSDVVTVSTAPGAETKLISFKVTPINNSSIGESVTLTTVRAVTRPGPNREDNNP